MSTAVLINKPSVMPDVIVAAVAAAMIGWLGIVHVSAAYRAQRAKVRQECLDAPGASVVITASGAQLCISGTGAVWL